MLRLASAVTSLPSKRPCSYPLPVAPESYTTSNVDGEELGLYDVICGRDKEAFRNVGNRRFRVTVSLTLGRYQQAQSRKDKSSVIKSVAILVQNNGGRFLQKKEGKWVQLNEKQTHEKVGHALRDMAMATSKMTERAGPEFAEGLGLPTVCAAPKRHLSTAAFEQKAKRAKFLGMLPEVPTASRSDVGVGFPPQKAVEVSFPAEFLAGVDDANNDYVGDADTILSWLMDESDQVMFEL